MGPALCTAQPWVRWDQRCRQSPVIPHAKGDARQRLPLLLLCPESLLQSLPPGSQGFKRRVKDKRQEGETHRDNPEEIRLLGPARETSFISLFSISSPSSEIISEIFFPSALPNI